MRMVKNIKGRRYSKLDEKHAYHLLEKPNSGYIAQLKPADLETVRALRKLLSRRRAMKFDEFNTLLYTLVTRHGARKQENRAHQQLFFRHIYQLLLGNKNGPRLAQFLSDIEMTKAQALLDV